MHLIVSAQNHVEQQETEAGRTKIFHPQVDGLARNPNSPPSIKSISVNKLSIQGIDSSSGRFDLVKGLNPHA